MKRELHEANRLSWNAATRAHNRHKGDQAAFLRDGGSTLYDTELALLGDVRGRSLVHLQCNAGQDTLSLAKLGADVTGVDISDEAIDFARRLSAESGIPGTFVRSDVFDWFESYDGPGFDVAFASYGTLGWLSDLPAWGRGVAKVLKPGGRLVLVEFHPVFFLVDAEWRIAFPYTLDEPISVPGGVNDYVADSGGALSRGNVIEEPFVNPHPCHEFAYSVADILGSVLGAGLVVERFEEHEHTNGWRPYPTMRALGGGRFGAPEGKPGVPMMLGLVARRPGA